MATSGGRWSSGKRLAGNRNFQVMILEAESEPQEWRSSEAASQGVRATPMPDGFRCYTDEPLKLYCDNFQWIRNKNTDPGMGEDE